MLHEMFMIRVIQDSERQLEAKKAAYRRNIPRAHNPRPNVIHRIARFTTIALMIRR